MPDLLLELRSEEIPARMQRKAAGDLRKRVTDALVDAGLTYEGAQEHWTPRRLALDIRGLTAKSANVREERKGPRTDAPAKAIEGFLRGAGLESIDQAKIVNDSKKGDFYVAIIEKPGRRAEDIIAEAMPAIIRDFPWPKSMRWGAASAKPGALRWVRPLQSIVCTFGPETEEPVVVDFEIDGIKAGNVTYGHRFHAPEAITVRRFEDYSEKLMRAKVVLDAARRKEMIATDAKNLAFASGLELVEDEALLDEVSGLVEWPVVLMGEFEESFLAIPPEVIRLTIKENQKCFVLRPQTGEGLANRFILVSNIEAKDHGVEIARGNGKVVRARLSDAFYFWQSDQDDLPDLEDLKPSAEKFGLDLTKPLDQRMAKLDDLGVTFHAKLGTQGEHVERIRKLARELAPVVARSSAAQGQRPLAGQAAPAQASAKRDAAVSEDKLLEQVDRAALLAKADLTTEAVGEFPELQGLMGRRYAELQGEDHAVAAAVEDHYKPLGPTDSVPTDPVTIAVALADKLDMLVGFWAIDEKPTGSKDPYALRRAALGVIRLLLENGVRLEVSGVLFEHYPQIYQREDFVYRLLTRDEAGIFKYPKFWDDQMWPSTTPDGEPYWPLDEIQFSPNESVWVYNAEIFPGDPNAILFPQYLEDDGRVVFDKRSKIQEQSFRIAALTDSLTDLLSFFHDRLKVYLRDQGARHDLIDAVISPEADDLLAITQRVQALGELLDTEDGQNLLAGTKRAANILTSEEKKGTRVAETVDPALLAEDAEKALYQAVNRVESEAGEAIEREDYSGAMRALASLRAPIDAFFDAVLVNAEDEAVRANRLALLARIRAATSAVADFSRIAG